MSCSVTRCRIVARILYVVWTSSPVKPITFMASATALNSAPSLMLDWRDKQRKAGVKYILGNRFFSKLQANLLMSFIH